MAMRSDAAMFGHRSAPSRGPFKGRLGAGQWSFVRRTCRLRFRSAPTARPFSPRLVHWPRWQPCRSASCIFTAPARQGAIVQTITVKDCACVNASPTTALRWRWPTRRRCSALPPHGLRFHAARIIRSLQKVTSYPRLDDANGARNLTRPRRSLSSIRRIDVGP